MIRKAFLLAVGALSIACSEITQAIEEAVRFVEEQDKRTVRCKPDTQSETSKSSNTTLI